MPVMVGLSYEVPRWYLTSPVPVNDPWSPDLMPVNSLKICCMGLRTTLASTFSRPANTPRCKSEMLYWNGVAGCAMLQWPSWFTTSGRGKAGDRHWRLETTAAFHTC